MLPEITHLILTLMENLLSNRLFNGPLKEKFYSLPVQLLLTPDEVPYEIHPVTYILSKPYLDVVKPNYRKLRIIYNTLLITVTTRAH